MLHDIFFGKKAKEYRAQVYGLLPELGLDLRVFGLLAPRDTMVEGFRLQRFTAHEAALIIGYSSLVGFRMKSGQLVAETLYETLVEHQADWTRDGHIKAPIAREWPAKGKEHLTQPLPDRID